MKDPPPFSWTARIMESYRMGKEWKVEDVTAIVIRLKDGTEDVREGPFSRVRVETEKGNTPPADFDKNWREATDRFEERHEAFMREFQSRH